MEWYTSPPILEMNLEVIADSVEDARKQTFHP